MIPGTKHNKKLNNESYSNNCPFNLKWAADSNRVNLDMVPVPCYNVKLTSNHLGADVATGGTDPFPLEELKAKASLKVIKDNYDNKLTISTRADLRLFNYVVTNTFNPLNHKVRIHILNQNTFLQWLIEVRAPSNPERLKSAVEMKKRGIDVTIVLDCIEGLSPEYNEFGEFCEQFELHVEYNYINLTIEARERIEKVLNIKLGETVIEHKPETRTQRIERSGLKLVVNR